MTLIIGVRCVEGVVLAADSEATMGSLAGSTASQRTIKKIAMLKGNIAIAVSGPVGLAQEFAAAVEDGYAAGAFKGRAEVAMATISTRLATLIKPRAEMGHLVSQAMQNGQPVSDAIASTLLAISLDKEPCLVEFTSTCAPSLVRDELPFASIGSGQSLADPFLAFVRRTLWPSNGPPSLQAGIFGAYWTLRHVIETCTGGVGGEIQVVTLTKGPSIRQIPAGELEGHDEALKDLESTIGRWRAEFTRAPESPDPEAPPK